MACSGIEAISLMAQTVFSEIIRISSYSSEKHEILNRPMIQLWIVRMPEIYLTLFEIKWPCQS